ncbi:hypothetical protein ABT186_46030 [Streptomyces sp. NPDC001634]|uniref:hypothetical protein n=1 Tax=Streptomyces sp. NPDC001634 TaxID=3154390 RepID=UPI00332BB9F3
MSGALPTRERRGPGAAAVGLPADLERGGALACTIGEYAKTALQVARACMPGGHYLDLAADPTATSRLRDLHEEAATAGSTLVTGAGFGVLATEAVVVTLCANRPVPSHVRVDALSSMATEAGVMGAAFAASIIDVLTTGGLRYEDGRLAKTRLGADVQHLTLPDGQKVKSAGAPSGELIAAQRASGAPNVTITSALAPPARPYERSFRSPGSCSPSQHCAASPSASWPASVSRRPPVPGSNPGDTPSSPGRTAPAEKDGYAWLRADDGMDYTAGAAAETAARLARGEGKPGAHTPAAALGPDLTTATGGTFILR